MDKKLFHFISLKYTKIIYAWYSRVELRYDKYFIFIILYFIHLYALQIMPGHMLSNKFKHPFHDQIHICTHSRHARYSL